MRVRILKWFSSESREYRAGEIVEVEPEKADRWIRSGLAMQDKSLDGAKETKSKPRSMRR